MDVNEQASLMIVYERIFQSMAKYEYRSKFAGYHPVAVVITRSEWKGSYELFTGIDFKNTYWAISMHTTA